VGYFLLRFLFSEKSKIDDDGNDEEILEGNFGGDRVNTDRAQNEIEEIDKHKQSQRDSGKPQSEKDQRQTEEEHTTQF